MIARAAACALAVLFTCQQPAPPTFRSGIDVVSLDVSVRDRTRVITGLTAADFEVLDNGVRQELADVSYDKLPIDVTVALDISGSVTGDMLARLQRAVTQLMKELGKDDRLRLFTFHARVARVVDFTNDVARVERAMRDVSAGGGTSIYDTISTALVSADQVDRRQLLVVFTDGADSTSITEPPALFEVAQRASVAVTTVMPFATTSDVISTLNGRTIVAARQTAQSAERIRFFQRLALDTGGQVIPQIREGDDLTSAFSRVLGEFRLSYVLRFVPKGIATRGFHTLQVSVPARSGLTFRARRGYWVD